MPLPKPKPKESEKDFIKRAMSSDIMKSDFPDIKQRYAVTKSIYKNRFKHLKEFLEFKKLIDCEKFI